MKRNKLFSSIQYATLMGAVVFSAPQAFAQDEAQEIEEVQVTGSRIVRPNMVSTTAINTVDSEDIKITGAINIAEVLTALPGSGVSALTSTNSNFTTQGAGVNTVNLRNLGENRTLVLVNGRRFVAGLPGTQTVDLNSIPTQFIERVDVVTGGASAIYGSDALAGVVNIILKEDFEGLEITGQTGQTFDYNDDETHSLTMTGGFTFAEDKGNAMLSVAYNKENGVFARDRDGLERDGFYWGAWDPDRWAETRSPFYSSFSEKGRIIIPNAGEDSNGNIVNGDYVLDGNTVREFVSANDDGSPRDGFNRQAFRALSVPTERLNASAVVNYKITDDLNWFSEVTYASTETSSSMEPLPFSSAEVYGQNDVFCRDSDGDGVDDVCSYGLELSNPFIPDEMRQLAIDSNPGIAEEDLRLGFVRRTTELDPRGADSLRQTFRVVTGLEGSFLDDYNYELSVNYGRTLQNQTSSGQINVLNFRRSLEAEAITDANGDVTGYQCSDELSRLQGCVPVNIFGQGSMTRDLSDEEARALKNWLQANSSRANMVEQKIASGFISGPMFELPGGQAMFSTGFEYRDEYSEAIPDGLTQQGLNGGNKTPATFGSFTVKEAFVEFSLPLLSDMPLANSLEMDLSARYSDYSTVGSTTAYSSALRYSPFEDLLVRTQLAKAVRAPNINEIFGAPGQTFPGTTDPCANVALIDGEAGILANPDDFSEGFVDGRGDIAAACIQDPAVAARVAERDALILTQPEIQGVSGFNGGALAGGYELKEETANTFTLGFVWSPSFAEWAEPLSLSMDYYDIEIEDAIGGYGRSTMVTECYSGANYDPTSPFCSDIERFGEGTAKVGALRFINSFSQNLASRKTAGIDLDISYDFDLNSLGVLQASVNYTRLLEEENTPFDGANPVDTKGTLGSAENKANFRLRYAKGDAAVSLSTRWIDSSVFTNNKGDRLFGQKVPSAYFHNLNTSYSITDDISVSMGIDNITDEFIEFGQGAPGTSTGWNTAPDVYDPLGRRYYMGFTAKF